MPKDTIDFGYYWTKKGDGANYSVHYDKATKKLYAVREQLTSAPGNRVEIEIGTAASSSEAYDLMRNWWMDINKPNSLDLLQEKLKRVLKAK